MDFKLVDKKNMGIVSLLLLVIILSQSRFFNFLIDTALGRAFLIAFIIFITCCHKILGIVGVLLIIIMFNRSQIGILEGFDTEEIKARIESNMDACGNNTATTDACGNDTTANMANLQSKIAEVQSQNSTDACGNNVSSSNLTSLKTKVEEAKEGFDIIGTESRLKSGKQSNSISVNHKTRNSQNVLPFDENIFSTSSYSKF
uniref:Uncharacterized protein n=1 Tax=viral metagenome TaxID=1070528 RepID=A0A6C0IFD3_9ZZZZ